MIIIFFEVVVIVVDVQLMKMDMVSKQCRLKVMMLLSYGGIGFQKNNYSFNGCSQTCSYTFKTL